MEIIKFRTDDGNVWPWDYAVKIQDNIYKANSTILEIDVDKIPPLIREHGWVKDTTYYRNIQNLNLKSEVKFDRRVFNVIMKLCNECVLLDYHHKQKIKLNKEQLQELKPRMRVAGKDLLVPIGKAEDYVPDKYYKKYVG